MESSGMKQPNGNDKTKHPAEPVPRLFWTLEETAARLGLSVRSFSRKASSLRTGRQPHHHRRPEKKYAALV